MSKGIISYIVLFTILVLLQVMVLNNISVMGYGIPLLYIYFILVLPAALSPNWVITLGFLLGLTVDVFCDTPGMNALASTVTSALRQPMLSIYMSREDVPVTVPSAHSLGMGVFLSYGIYSECTDLYDRGILLFSLSDTFVEDSSRYVSFVYINRGY